MAHRPVRKVLALAAGLVFAVPQSAGASTRASRSAPTAEVDAQPSKSSGAIATPEPTGPSGGVDADAAEDTSRGDERTPDAVEPGAAAAPRDPETIRREKQIEEAERHFIEGRTLYNQGRYLEAAAEFERSFAAIERAETLYNIVLSHELAGQPIPALRAARRYRALPDCEGIETGTCAKHREKIRAIERRLRPQVGLLSLELRRGVELREIRVDGRPVPRADFPVALMPGTYEVELFGMKADQVRTFVVELYPGSDKSLDVAPFVEEDRDPVVGQLPPDGPDPEEIAARERRMARRDKALKISFWSGLGLTVAAGAATTTFGLLALDARRKATSEMCTPLPSDPTRCDPSDPNFPLEGDGDPSFVGRRDDLRRYRTLTSVMIGVTAVVGVTTAIVGIFAFSKQRSRRGSQRFGLSPTGLVVRW